jgi:8-oxo-dGTP diphosphatase
VLFIPFDVTPSLGYTCAIVMNMNARTTTTPRWKRRLAAAFQRVPLLLTLVRTIWRLTRPRVTLGAAGVVMESGRILLVEHLLHAYHPWGLPGGWVERGELPEAALQRELREELQLEVEVIKVVLVELQYKRHLDFAYLCRPLNSVGALSAELVDYRWVEPHELPSAMHKFHRAAIAAALNQLDR